MPSFSGCIRARGVGSVITGVPLRAVGGDFAMFGRAEWLSLIRSSNCTKGYENRGRLLWQAWLSAFDIGEDSVYVPSEFLTVEFRFLLGVLFGFTL